MQKTIQMPMLVPLNQDSKLHKYPKFTVLTRDWRATVDRVWIGNWELAGKISLALTNMANIKLAMKTGISIRRETQKYPKCQDNWVRLMRNLANMFKEEQQREPKEGLNWRKRTMAMVMAMLADMKTVLAEWPLGISGMMAGGIRKNIMTTLVRMQTQREVQMEIIRITKRKQL